MTDTTGATAYDRVIYPSGVFPLSHPNHLAAIARLHGLTPPPSATARVLDIGGGDGMNVLAMAEALPDAHFLSIDLAPTPVAQGQALAAAAGLGNVRIKVGDIVEAARTLEGPFDYIISHGVYAWVPAPVRDALMAVIARVLAPNGIAFVSYNSLPGGHYRRILRDMLLHEVGHLDDPAERAAAARDFLIGFVAPQEGDETPLRALRELAIQLTTRASGGLLHDELGDCFEPQAFADVAAAAARHGLRFLNNADPKELGDGLPEAALDDAALIRRVQSNDYATISFFHRTLLIRDSQTPARTPALDAVRDLYLSASCERPEHNVFKAGPRSVTITDDTLVSALAAALQAWPQRVRVGDLIDDAPRLRSIYNLFVAEIIRLHADPFPGASVPGDRPRASGLARAMAERGDAKIYTLDGRGIGFDGGAPGAFLRLLDGRRSVPEIAAIWAASPFADQVDADHALARFAAAGLLTA